MKTRLLRYGISMLVLLLIYAPRLRAQPYITSYTFEQVTGGVYVPITDSTMIANGNGLDDQVFPLTLPFTFNMDGVPYTNIYVSVNGFISFGTTNPGGGHWMLQSFNSGFRVASGFDADLASSTLATSNLSYKVTGAAPNRKLIVQWKNFGYTSTSALNVNFQIHLSEGSDLIEMVYGNCSLTGSGSSVSIQVGLRGTSQVTFLNRASLLSNWTGTYAGTNNYDNITYQTNSNPPSGLKYKFIPPPACAPPGPPTNLSLTGGAENINISYNNSGTPAAHQFLIVRTPGSTPLNAMPVNGTAYPQWSSLGNGTVVYNGPNTSFNNTSLSQSTLYTYTIIPYQTANACIGSLMYNTSNLLTGSMQTTSASTYTWTPVGSSTDWTVAGNWQPARTTPLDNDTLLFNSGGILNVNNVPTQTLGAIKISGNTSLTLSSTTAKTVTLKQLLQVDTGSLLDLEGQVKLAYTSSGSTKTALIYGGMWIGSTANYIAANCNTTVNGTLTLSNSGIYTASSGETTLNGKLNMSGSGSYVAANGTTRLNDTVTLTGNAFFNTSGASLVQVNTTVNNSGSGASFSVVNGSSAAGNTVFNAGAVYNHMRNGGNMPRATYNAAATANITGITNTAPTFFGTADMGNLIWNCPNQSISITTGGAIYAIKGNLHVLHTGTYPLRLAGTPTVYGEFRQENSTLVVSSSNAILTLLGTTNLNSGVLDISGLGGTGTALYINGNLNQSLGHMITNSGSGNGPVSFSGTQLQQINLQGTFGTGRINYTLDNPAGALLTGTIPVRSNSLHTILNGGWSGPGTFSYETTATLNYTLNGNHYCTATEWPVLNGPQKILMQQNGGYPNNMTYMPPGDRTIPFITIDGILVLGNSNLDATGTLSVINAGVDGMIATNGSGQLLRSVTANYSGPTIWYPVGDITGIPEYSYVILNVKQTPVARKIGVRVTDSRHPFDSSANNYLTRYWSFSDDGGSNPVRIIPTFNFPASNMAGNQTQLSRWNGSAWSNVSAMQSAGGATLTLLGDTIRVPAEHILDNSSFTGRDVLNNSNVYSWTGAISKEYAEPQNWAPTRTYPAYTDVLQFNSGNSDTVKNIPSTTIGKMLVTNNTTAILQAKAGTANSQKLLLKSDLNTATHELTVDQGSSLILNGPTTGLIIEFNGDSSTGVINGNMTMVSGSTNVQGVNFANSSSSVLTINGYFLNSGTTSNNNFGGINSSFVIYGTYEHNFSGSGGTLIPAKWMDGSLFKVTSGIPSPYSTENNFYKVIYDCPGQTNLQGWSVSRMRVRDSFIVNSTGTGRLSLGNGYTDTIHHFVQRGGIVELSATGTNQTSGNIDITGSWIQENGTLTSPATTANIRPVLNFKGNNGIQTASFYNTAPTGTLAYRISNPAGIQLNGTGTLTTDFEIDTNSAIYVALPLNSPIQSTLRLKYLENSTLALEGNGNITPDTTIFPAADGPHNLTINIGASNKLTMPGSRTIYNELAMIAGDIELGAAHMTIGTSATKTGKLTYTSGISGNINVTTGSLTRWYSTTALPTSPDAGLSTSTNIGFYPLSNGTSKRHVALYFSSITALSNAGTIKVSHNSLPGYATGLSITDAATTIQNRSNASWSFETGNGMAMANGSFGMRITGSDIFTLTSPANLRIVHNNSVSGNHLTGAGAAPDYMALRNTISLSALNSEPFYIGTSNDNISSAYFSVATGNWNTPATWNRNAVPGTGDIVYISANTTVTANSTANSKVIYINKNGTLSTPAGTLNADSAIVNDGMLSIDGGTVNMGPAGGGKNGFTNTGTLDMVSGTLNINGYLALMRGNDFGTAVYPGIFRQSGGTINIDGNANGVSFNSVSSSQPILRVGTPRIYATGGTVTIVDPHAGTTIASSIAINFSETLPYAFGAGHTIAMGNGTSTHSGGTTDGFIISGTQRFGKLQLNGSPSGNNRVVTQSGTSYLSGDLEVNNYAVFRPSGTLNLYGNVVLNAGGTFNAYNSNLNFLDDTASLLGQTVGGPGTLGTDATSGAHFKNIQINNPKGVTFNTGAVQYNGTLDLLKGVLSLSSSSSVKELTANSISNSGADKGWINGKLIRRTWTTSGGTNYTMLFPLGDNNNYTPLTIESGNWIANRSILAYTVSGDHPSITSGPLNPAKSVNRYYVIDTLDPVVASNVRITMAYPDNQIDAGASWSYLNGARYINGSWADMPMLSLAANSAKLSAPNRFSGQYQLGELQDAPIITQQPANYLSCSGTPAFFSVTAQGASSYQWQVNTGGSWQDLSVTNNYSGVQTPALTIAATDLSMHNYQYRCAVGNNVDTIVSQPATLTMSTVLAPTITIATGNNDTVCPNLPVNFTATITNGGSNPAYQWKVNGQNAGSNASILTLTNVTNGTTVTCELASSSPCAVPATVTSNSITPVVLSNALPVTVVTSSNGNAFCSGTTVTFTAQVTAGGGNNPSYKWYKNNIIVGTNSATYTTNDIVQGDMIYCIVDNHNPCTSFTTDVSNILHMSVSTPVVTAVAISTAQGTSICGGTAVTFTATPTNGGTTPVYQWKKNGNNVGTNSMAYTDAALANGDIITCAMTSSEPCVTNTTVTATPITMTVSNSLSPTITIAADAANPACAGQALTYHATITNGGTAQTYQWKKNGNNVGTNSNSYTDATLSNGDQISCALSISTGSSCYTSTTASSNVLSAAVTPNTLPVVTLTASPSTTICNGQNVTFSAGVTNGGTTPVYQWKKNGNNVGANNATYQDAALSNGDIVNCTVTYNTGCYTPANGNAITMTVQPSVTPSVSISTPQTSICSGSTATFTATPTNGGTTPVYQWKKNGNNVGTNNMAYTDAALANGDIITCAMTSSEGCVTSATVSAAPITMTVNNSLIPSISIAADPANPACAGQALTYHATITNGGTAQTYQWKKNGNNVGTNSNTYTDATLSNGDQISCALSISTGSSCYTSTTASSNVLSAAVTPNTLPVVTLTASPATTICNGQNVIFSAGVTNGGTTPVYQWKKNGNNVGANNATYQDAALSNGDIVNCTVSYNTGCYTPASGNAITMTVQPNVTPSVSISTPQTSICNGSAATFTATPTNGGTTPIFQWKKNGNNVGTNSNTYTDAAPVTGDVITCTLTGNAPCGVAGPVNSNAVTMTVNPVLAASISISATQTTACSNTNLTFMAAAVNGGSTPSYQWRINGNPTGTNSASFTTNMLLNGDVVTCTLTSNATCVSNATAGSNGIAVSITPSVTPAVSIAATGSTTICPGTAISFTATQTNGGSSPVYQWRVNNQPVGTNSATYSSSTWSNNDVVTCILTSNETCITGNNLSSNTVAVTVTTPVTPTIDISAAGGDIICDGTAVTFTANTTGEGSAPAYQWKKNGNNVGTGGNSYTDPALDNGDVIACELTSNETCVTSGTAQSNAITMTVNAIVNPSVSIAANPGTTIDPGTNVTFTATVVNGGSTPSFQWKKNGNNVGTNAPTYTTNGIADGDQVTVTVQSSNACASPVSANSNTLVMHLNPVSIKDREAGAPVVHIYPNPSREYVIINIDDKGTPDQKSSISLLTLDGKVLISTKARDVQQAGTGYKLSLPETLASGVYLIRMEYKGYLIERKIFVER